MFSNMFLVVLFSINLVTLLPQCSAAKLSNSIPRCSMGDPKLGNCIVNAAEKLRKAIREGGIAEMGIPGYDPRVLSTFNIEQESDMINLTATAWNYTIRGLDNFDISEVQFDRQTETFTGKIQFDPVSIISAYELYGKLIFIPVRGKGGVHFAMGPINGTFEITGRITETNNVKYYYSKGVQIRLNIDDISIHFEGLFDGDVEKGAMTNDLINRNSKAIMKAGTPLFEKVSEKYISRYFKWLTRKYPLYELFLE